MDAEKLELVSVVIPTYNRQLTIEQSIRSILQQTYNKLEVIVVDDCSSDNTESVVRAVDDPRVFFYRLDRNSGACVARNYGVSKARGDIIAFQDSDDVWAKDKLAKEIAYMNKHDCDFVSCGFKRIYEDGRCEYIGQAQCSEEKIDNWCMLLDNNWVSTQTIVCRKKCFDKIRFDPKLKRYQDWDLALQAATQFKIGSLNESLVDVYLQSDSITRTVDTYGSKLAVIEKHTVDIIPGNKKMQAQYYKSKAGVVRARDVRLASQLYRKSFCLQPNMKCLVLWLLSFTRLIVIRDKTRALKSRKKP